MASRSAGSPSGMTDGRKAASPREGRGAAALRIAPAKDGLLAFELSGPLDSSTIAPLWSQGLAALARDGARDLVIEGGAVSYCDGAGAAMIADFEDKARAAGRSFEVASFPEKYRELLDITRTKPDAAPATAPESRGFIENVGRQTVDLFAGLAELIAYTGEVVAALAYGITHPHTIRWKDALRVMQQVGVTALPVIALVLFLIGLILAYQTAGMFHQYGADVFLADMLGISLLRELGPLMVAIMITARSGSAFAAEIGTMQVNEEVDALTTMGLNPVRFLVTPRVVAAVLVTPLLAVFGNLFGLLGGLVVWIVDLDLPLIAYRNQLKNALDPADFLGGIGKAFAFGILIAAIGCIRGLQTHGGPASVGESATRSVVSGIVLIVLADMVFGVVFYHLGI